MLSDVWSLATENGLILFYEASSCVNRNISNADSLQRVAEKSVPIYFWFGSERSNVAHFHWITACQYEKKSQLCKWMILGSAPLPSSSSCLLAFLWSSCRSACQWVISEIQIANEPGALEEGLALNSVSHSAK